MSDIIDKGKGQDLVLTEQAIMQISEDKNDATAKISFMALCKKAIKEQNFLREQATTSEQRIQELQSSLEDQQKEIDALKSSNKGLTEKEQSLNEMLLALQVPPNGVTVQDEKTKQELRQSEANVLRLRKERNDLELKCKKLEEAKGQTEEATKVRLDTIEKENAEALRMQIDNAERAKKEAVEQARREMTETFDTEIAEFKSKHEEALSKQMEEADKVRLNFKAKHAELLAALEKFRARISLLLEEQRKLESKNVEDAKTYAALMTTLKGRLENAYKEIEELNQFKIRVLSMSPIATTPTTREGLSYSQGGFTPLSSANRRVKSPLSEEAAAASGSSRNLQQEINDAVKDLPPTKISTLPSSANSSSK